MSLSAQNTPREHSPRKNTERSYKNSKNHSSKRRKRRRRSRYYRERRRKQMLFAGAAALLLLLIIFFSVRVFVKSRPGESQKEKTALEVKSEKRNEETNKETNVEENESISPVPFQPVTLTVSVVGDCTLGTDEAFDYDSSLNAYFYSNGPDYFLENVRDIFSSDDLTIANMEGTLTDSDNRQDKTFAFKAPPEFAQILSGSSVEAVNTANNHSHDYGEESFSDTLSALDSEGIVHFGYEETAIMEVKGVKVGLVGIYELNDHLDRASQLKENIQKVRSDGADLVIVIFHWGNEKDEIPDSNQTALGRMAIDEGADLVCGHHSHVLQGIEEYKGRNIVYSLGNFCFGGNSAPSDMDTMIFQQTFTIDENGVRADNVTNIIPCSISSAYGYNNYQPTPSEGEEKERILQKIQERSSWIPLP